MHDLFREMQVWSDFLNRTRISPDVQSIERIAVGMPSPGIGQGLRQTPAIRKIRCNPCPN